MKPSRFSISQSRIERSVVRGETTMKSSNQNKSQETEMTCSKTSRQGFASEKTRGNLLRLLWIVMAAGIIMLTNTNPILAAVPVAFNDNYAVGEDNTLSVPAVGVLTNDTDGNGHTIYIN
ncbi:MAG: hypothetical protein ACM34H_01595, partial [Deltaproteobacteria bacterium]